MLKNAPAAGTSSSDELESLELESDDSAARAGIANKVSMSSQHISVAESRTLLLHNNHDGSLDLLLLLRGRGDDDRHDDLLLVRVARAGAGAGRRRFRWRSTNTVSAHCRQNAREQANARFLAATTTTFATGFAASSSDELELESELTEMVSVTLAAWDALISSGTCGGPRGWTRTVV